MASFNAEEVMLSSSSDNSSGLRTYFDTVPFVGEEQNISVGQECIKDPVRTAIPEKSSSSGCHSINEGYVGTLKHWVKRKRKKQEHKTNISEADNEKEHGKTEKNNNYRKKIPKSVQNWYTLAVRKQKSLRPLPELFRSYVRRLRDSASECYRKNMNIEPMNISSPAESRNKLSLRSFRLGIGNLGPLKRKRFSPRSENILVERYVNADNNSTIYLINDKVSQTSSRLFSVHFDNTYEVPYHSFCKKECEKEPFPLKKLPTCDAVIQADGREERESSRRSCSNDNYSSTKARKK